MQVLNYKKLKSNLYQVEFDDGKSYKIYDDIIIKYELLIDKNISKNKLNDILCENELLESYYQALKYINIKMRTEKEIRAYLKKKDISSVSVDYAVDKLKNEGYINEDIYTKAYIQDAINLSNDGPKKIEADLLKLGIKEETITKYLDYDNEIWKIKINKILEKKAKVNKYSKSLFKNKMYTYLYSLGYSSNELKNIIDDFEIDTTSSFNKEADKTWKLLINKYDKKEAILKFKNKLYQKGYSLDEINSYIEKEED